jgi:hypothetical protein
MSASASAKKSHPLNSGASLTTILDDVVAFTVGHALLNLHYLFANKAAQQINQRAFIIAPEPFPAFPLRPQIAPGQRVDGLDRFL